MKNYILLILLLINSNTLFGQTIQLSENIGEINSNSKYRTFKKHLGEPDSTYQNQWNGKTKSFYKFFYKKYSLVFKMTDTPNKSVKNQKLKEITIQNTSILKLNGFPINKIALSNISEHFGNPIETNTDELENYQKYIFSNKKHLSIIYFYFDNTNSFKTIIIEFSTKK